MNAIHIWQNPLDSRQLNDFVTLARRGSFRAVGRELFVTHSAISHSLDALENELGCRLLNRLGKRIELTAAGEAFLHYAQSCLRILAEARQIMRDFKRWGGQRLRIGAGGQSFSAVFAVGIRSSPEPATESASDRENSSANKNRDQSQDWRAGNCPRPTSHRGSRTPIRFFVRNHVGNCRFSEPSMGGARRRASQRVGQRAMFFARQIPFHATPH